MIGIIDYGAGNTQSVKNALDRIGIDSFLSSDIAVLDKAEKLILPGVGHAQSAMNKLQINYLVDYLRQQKKELLGICLGMQLLCSTSEEGPTNCLGIIDEDIRLFDQKNKKVPLIGWNHVRHENHKLFKDIESDSYFYFVHSYYLPTSKFGIANADYFGSYSVAIQKSNFYGVQFHPEKSGKAGQQLLLNFCTL